MSLLHKKTYLLTVGIIVLLAIVYVTNKNSSTNWYSQTYSLNENFEKYIILEEELDRGQKIITKFDPAPTQGKGRLVLEWPNEVAAELAHTMRRNQIEIIADQDGISPGYTGSNSPSVYRDSIIKMKFEWNRLVENLEATFHEDKIPLSIILN